MSIRIVADDKIPFLKGALEPFADIEYIPGKAIDRKILMNADALLIRTRTRCNRDLLEGTSVKFIATATIGYDHIDTDYCREKNIYWTNAPGCNSGSVMQYIAASLLYYARNNQIDLTGRVMGVVGIGNVGKKIVKLAEMLSIPVVMNDPPRARTEGPCGYLSLEGIKREADIISLHVPLNCTGEDKTFHLIEESFFSGINPQTLLINSSRGEVVKTNALKSAMEQGSINNCILDVWENEPEIDPELASMAYIATPHIAGYSVDGKANGTSMSVQALSRFFGLGIDDWEPEGLPEPQNPVLTVNGLNKSFQEILTELVLQTYPISRDHSWLQSNLSNFEQYRGDYPVRREFPAYLVETENIGEEERRKLRRLGFRLPGISG